MRRGLLSVACSVMALVVSSCAILSSSTPLDVQTYHSPEKSRTLIVLLPGIFDGADDFFRHGFVTTLSERGIAADVVAADAHYGYYVQRNIVNRIKNDIIDPAKRSGYRDIWLVGVSLGGYGALLYARAYPADLAGVVAIAPYMGRGDVARDIASSGGLYRWAPDPKSSGRSDYQVWQWLQEYPRRRVALPTVCLSYGQADRFAFANDLVAEVLPAKMVTTVSGGHDWATWKQLWGKVVDKGHCLTGKSVEASYRRRLENHSDELPIASISSKSSLRQMSPVK